MNHNFIQLNKFSELHSNKIIFCKTDYIFQDFDTIQNINSDVILITGNSDYPITEKYFDKIPKNIKKWYAQNALYFSDILEPIPLGIENKLPSIRQGHGIGYFDRVQLKEKLLSKKKDILPNKLIYSNFDIKTNLNHRNECKNISQRHNFIDWEENNLTLEVYFNKIMEYEMILCPAGNGVDTHRLWEVLYSNRIPVTIKIGDYKIYELYKHFPIIVLETTEDLKNKELLENKLSEVKNKKFDIEMLYFNYWEKEILNYRK